MNRKSFSVVEGRYEYDGKKEIALTLYSDGRRAPAILYLHGYHGSVWGAIHRARNMQKKGYAVYVAPILGLGHSHHEPDFNGPRTREALKPVLDALFEDEENIDTSRVAIWGIGRGANLAANIAVSDERFRALVLESGFYDLKNVYAHPLAKGTLKERLQNECGASDEALLARTPISGVHKILCPVLMLAYGSDDALYQEEFRSFGAALETASVPTESHVAQEGGSESDANVWKQYVMPFLDKRLHPER
jgi:dipeptidyl aminopeptidase/acylaminoacyl peptidase